MTEAVPSHEVLVNLATQVFGPTIDDVTNSLFTLFLYKADPDNLERLLRWMEQDDFPVTRHQAKADQIAVSLRKWMDEVEKEAEA